MYSISILATGSSGNCCLISDGHTGVLVDSGINVQAIHEQHVSIWTDVQAVLLTHEHADHARYAKYFAERYAKPIYATRGTFSALNVPVFAQHTVHYSQWFEIGTLKIMPIPLSHDANEPCGYYIANQLKETIAFISDTGTVDGAEIEADCYMIEANYDEDILSGRLESGELYAGLHARLSSEFGHLSIQQASEWLSHNAHKDSHIILMHKSQDNAQRFAAFDNYSNVTVPDIRGRLQYRFGTDDRCPF